MIRAENSQPVHEVIIGNGLLAHSFSSRYADRGDVVVFASGVSNSTETAPAAFAREREMLARAMAARDATLVYFSSCGVTSAQETAYIAHKRQMEQLVGSHPQGLILRLPQVVGRSANPNTLTNYLAAEILSGRTLSVWRYADRNLIDIDDIVPIASELIENRAAYPSCVAIASTHTIRMPDLIDRFEVILGKKVSMEILEKGESLVIDTSISSHIAERLGIDFGPGYVERLLRKYYGNPANA